MEIDEEKLSLLIESAARKAVKAELDERQHIPPLEHYLQHQWVKNQMQGGASLRSVVVDTAVRWGTIAAIGTFTFGVIQLLKLKLTGVM